ncbi:hypothetical protein QUA70_17250 [Microcoleus sp. LAD1_D5]|uniref:hypothetical protein n=1 Tax=Microcoleus sp. LAD1_D5 TaxID=2818813 RepID=UPI002FCFD772
MKLAPRIYPWGQCFNSLIFNLKSRNRLISVIGMLEMILSATAQSTFKDAAKKQTGDRRRDFRAKVAEDYFNV